MPTDPEHPRDRELDQRHCPVCWARFTPNSQNNPYPRRYCCGACRIEDSRRRREREQTRLFFDANLDVIRARHRADVERLEVAQARRLLNQWRSAP